MLSMIALKNYLMDVKQASLRELASHFSVNADTMRLLLAHWQRKGTVRENKRTDGCQSACFGCNQALPEIIYEWISVH